VDKKEQRIRPESPAAAVRQPRRASSISSLLSDVLERLGAPGKEGRAETKTTSIESAGAGETEKKKIAHQRLRYYGGEKRNGERKLERQRGESFLPEGGRAAPAEGENSEL